MIETSAFEIAQRFSGMKEVAGFKDNPMILAMLKLDGDWPEHDEVPWCSAFANFVAWILRLPRSKSLQARSWLEVGKRVSLEDASVGFDVVIFWRGEGTQPGPEVIDAGGHVGFYAGHDETYVQVLGGNQNDTVSVKSYRKERILGVRRLT
jgi:uncharacterized protein (TIGR02594 family)